MKSIKSLIWLLILACFVLAGCSSGGENKTVKNTSDRAQSQPIESTKTAAPTKTQTYFYNGKNFSNDVAWVQRDSSQWECIDNKGKTLFSLGAGSVPLTDFTDGGAIIETTNSKNEKEKKIVDKIGTVVFPKDDGNKYQFINSYGNCNFVQRHINTFEKTEDQTGIVDNAGKWILEPTSDLKVESFYGTSREEVIVHGIFKVSYHGNNFYDSISNKFFKSEIEPGNNYYLAYLRCIIEYFYQEDLVFLVKEDNRLETYGSLQFYISHYTDLANIGFHNTGTGFYDRNHNLVIDLSSYKEINPIGGFSGGYCSVKLKNPQGNYFYSVIDKKGDRMFEPISQSLGNISCGRIFVTSGKDTGYYIDVNGKTVIPNIKYGSDFSENGLAKVGSTNNGTNGINYIDTDGNIAF